MSPYLVDVDDYCHDLTWGLAKQYIKGAQYQQKCSYEDHHFQVGDGTVSGKSWKLAHPHQGLYRVLGVTPTNIEARLVDSTDVGSIIVAVNRVRPCPTGVSDVSWTGYKNPGRKKHVVKNTQPVQVRTTGPVTRSMSSDLK